MLRPDDELFAIVPRGYLPQGLGQFGTVTVIVIAHAKSSKLESISNTLLGLIYSWFFLKPDILHIHRICSAVCTPIAKLLPNEGRGYPSWLRLYPSQMEQSRTAAVEGGRMV